MGRFVIDGMSPPNSDPVHLGHSSRRFESALPIRLSRRAIKFLRGDMAPRAKNVLRNPHRKRGCPPMRRPDGELQNATPNVWEIPATRADPMRLLFACRGAGPVERRYASPINDDQCLQCVYVNIRRLRNIKIKPRPISPK